MELYTLVNTRSLFQLVLAVGSLTWLFKGDSVENKKHILFYKRSMENDRTRTGITNLLLT